MKTKEISDELWKRGYCYTKKKYDRQWNVKRTFETMTKHKQPIIRKDKKKGWCLINRITPAFMEFLESAKNLIGVDPFVDKDEDGLITIQEAFAWTKEKVANVSAKSLGRLQVPELIGSSDTVLTMPR